MLSFAILIQPVIFLLNLLAVRTICQTVPQLQFAELCAPLGNIAQLFILSLCNVTFFSSAVSCLAVLFCFSPNSATGPFCHALYPLLATQLSCHISLQCNIVRLDTFSDIHISFQAQVYLIIYQPFCGLLIRRRQP